MARGDSIDGFEIIHRKGWSHNNVDALSRIPCRLCGRLLEELPVVHDESVEVTTVTKLASLNVNQHQQEYLVLDITRAQRYINFPKVFSVLKCSLYVPSCNSFKMCEHNTARTTI